MKSDRVTWRSCPSRLRKNGPRCTTRLPSWLRQESQASQARSRKTLTKAAANEKNRGCPLNSSRRRSQKRSCSCSMKAKTKTSRGFRSQTVRVTCTKVSSKQRRSMSTPMTRHSSQRSIAPQPTRKSPLSPANTCELFQHKIISNFLALFDSLRRTFLLQ
jgi:hypothetical protein